MMKQSLFSKERLSDVINLSLLEEYMNQLYKDIQVPIALFDLDGEIICHSPCIALCKEITCKDPRMHILCKETCARFCDSRENLFYCPNGLMKYRIPLRVKNKVIAYVVLRQFLTEQEESESIKNMLIKRSFDREMITSLINGIPILYHKKVEKIMAFMNELVIILNDMITQHRNRKELEEKAKKCYEKFIILFEDIVNEKRMKA